MYLVTYYSHCDGKYVVYEYTKEEVEQIDYWDDVVSLVKIS